jgi:hypothetical protein
LSSSRPSYDTVSSVDPSVLSLLTLYAVDTTEISVAGQFLKYSSIVLYRQRYHESFAPPILLLLRRRGGYFIGPIIDNCIRSKGIFSSEN